MSSRDAVTGRDSAFASLAERIIYCQCAGSRDRRNAFSLSWIYWGVDLLAKMGSRGQMSRTNMHTYSMLRIGLRWEVLELVRQCTCYVDFGEVMQRTHSVS